uniref:DUF3352 domain-containing protein n=1 Tax=Schlesneria paludicola TaxID=360056 RepID=A0A7C4LLH0_9PLAN
MRPIPLPPVRLISLPRRWPRWCPALAGMLLWVVGQGVAAEVATLAEYLPEGAIGSVELTNLAALVERIEQSPLPGLIADSDDYRKWADSDAGRKFRGGQAILEGQLGISLSAAVKRIAGEQMFLAVYPPSEGRPNPDGVLLVRLADAQIGPLLKDKLIPLAALAGDQVRLEERNGSLRARSRDGNAHAALHDRWIIVSNDATRLEAVLTAVARPDAPADNTLADSPAWKNLPLKVDSDATWLRVCVDTRRIQQLVNQERLLPAKVDNPLASLLLGGLMECAAMAPRVHGTLVVGSSDFAVSLHVERSVQQLDAAHQTLLAAREIREPFATPVVPRFLASLELSRQWAEWYRRRDELHEPQVLPEFDKFETGLATFLPGKDFAEDVLGLLNPALTIIVARQTYPHLKGQPGVQLPAMAVVLDLKDPQKGADVFNLFFQTITSISNIEAGKYGRFPWVLGSETHQGIQVAFARYLQTPEGKELPLVYNFQPAAAVVGQKYVAATSLELCRDLIDAYRKANTSPTGAEAAQKINLELNWDPKGFADLLQANRAALEAAGLQAGKSAAQVEREIQWGESFLRQLNRWQLRTLVHDQSVEVRLTGSWD